MNNFSNFIKRVCKADIVKVFSLNSISTFVRMLAGMISVKIVAVIIGPSGVALLGQLNNMVSILLGLANGGINNGITKYVSEYKNDSNEIRKILSNALRVTLVCTFIVAIALIVLHNHLSRWILLSDEYGYVFVCFGFTIILYTLNQLLISILNGFKEFKKYVRVNICGTIVGLIISISLVLSFGLKGALINAVTFQSIMFFVTLFMCRKCLWLTWNNFIGQFDKTIVRRLLNYSVMTISTLITGYSVQLFLRGYVISEISPVEAGWWEGMNRISNVYLSIITTSFAIYYLPRLAEIKDNDLLRREIFKCFKFIIPLLLLATTLLYCLRDFVIWFLFSSDFYPMRDLFKWQLCGDLVKIASWLLSYIMVAKAMTKTYVAVEIVSSLSFFGLGYCFLHAFGTIGLTQAYLVNYILYFIALVFLFRKLLFAKKI